MSSSIIESAPRRYLSLHRALKLFNIYLEGVCNTDDIDIILVLHHDTEISLYKVEKGIKGAKDQSVAKGIAITHIDLGNLLKRQGHINESEMKAGKPGFKEPVKSLLVMALSSEVQPRMMDLGQHLSKASVTQLEQPDHFIERGNKRTGEKDSTQQGRTALEDSSDERFTHNNTENFEKLVVAIYKEQDGQPIMRFSCLVDRESWKTGYFNGKDNQFLREVCSLIRNGRQQRLIHRLMLEYGLARAMLRPHEKRKGSASRHVVRRRGNMGSTTSFEMKSGSKDRAAKRQQDPEFNSPLVWRNFVNNHSLLQFLGERVQQEPAFKDQLLAYIEHSKKDKKWRQAAANAITILVRAGIPFIRADLRGIQIPGADLSYGMFDSAELQNADLRKVGLRGVWLQQTDLSGAQMTGVQFGELSYLTEGIEVYSCAYSPDGKSFVVGLIDGTISQYSTLNWERVRKLTGHRMAVSRVAFSPKGDQVASASRDSTLRLWGVETGSQLHVLRHASEVNGVAFSPQGDLIASCCDDWTAQLWDTATGECRMILRGHTEEVISIAYSRSGTQVASGSIDCTIRLWNVETGECSRILHGHSDRIWGLAYSPQGDHIASGSNDTTVRLWDVESGVCYRILAGHTDTINSVSYSPNGGQVASGGVDGTIMLWDVETGLCCHTLAGHSGSVAIVAYSPKGDQVASGSFDKTLRLWDVSTCSSRLISGCHDSSVMAIRCSPKGDQIVSGSRDKMIRLWDMETGACRLTLSGHTYTVSGVVYSPQGDWIASGCGNNSVRLWKTESGRCQHVLTGHTDWVNSVAFSPEGDVIASASEDNTVRLWDVVNGYCRMVLHAHSGGVSSVIYLSDGNKIATGSRDQTIRLWDLDTDECYKVLSGHTNWVREVVSSPQGDQLASTGDDMTIRLWVVESGECRLTLTGHTDGVWGISYSANGKLLASASLDKTVRLWDVSSGECRAVVDHFPDFVYCVAWCTSLDDNYLVTGCDDGSVLKWKVIEEEGKCRLQLQWSASKGALTAKGASIQGTHGLSALDKQLLKQRGAVGEPESLLCEPRKQLVTTA
ncbi:Transducin (beta)-like 1 X-linked receptor 1 [Mortierella sp. NVP85]|nr:Transducin (beta)-like 1 X-linked receptor 1 [Mortierella sp. NVP85]